MVFTIRLLKTSLIEHFIVLFAVSVLICRTVFSFQHALIYRVEPSALKSQFNATHLYITNGLEKKDKAWEKIIQDDI